MKKPEKASIETVHYAPETRVTVKYVFQPPDIKEMRLSQAESAGRSPTGEGSPVPLTG